MADAAKRDRTPLHLDLSGKEIAGELPGSYFPYLLSFLGKDKERKTIRMPPKVTLRNGTIKLPDGVMVSGDSLRKCDGVVSAW